MLFGFKQKLNMEQIKQVKGLKVLEIIINDVDVSWSGVR